MTDSKTIAQRLFPGMRSVDAAAPPATTSPLAHRLYPNLPRIAAPAPRIISHDAQPRPGFRKVGHIAYPSGKIFYREEPL
jgi:hypothetical protein